MSKPPKSAAKRPTTVVQTPIAVIPEPDPVGLSVSQTGVVPPKASQTQARKVEAIDATTQSADKPSITAVDTAQAKTVDLPTATPGRIVLVTLEAYPSHIVTRPAIVVSQSGHPFPSRINVHVFWDGFRDGQYLPTWRTDLAYSPDEEVNTWRYPTRS